MSQGAIQEHPAVFHDPVAAPAEGRAHDKGLLAIGIFKLLKSAFFFGVGIGAIHLLHKDLGDVAMRLATALNFDPEGKFVAIITRQVELIDTHHLREIGFFTFAYSALALTEGIGLMLEKAWAEFLTLGLTASVLPWEIYELVVRADAVRFALFLVNLLVLGYLIVLLQKKRKARGLA